jgi:nucleoid-associated protein YgaU
MEVVQNVEEALQMEEVYIEPYVPSPSEPLPPPVRREPVQPQAARPLVLPSLDSVQTSERETYQRQPAREPEQWTPPQGAVQEYVIQDGDTLQKISMKFYGTHGKWMNIYDANKDVLKDPNRIRVRGQDPYPFAGPGWQCACGKS